MSLNFQVWLTMLAGKRSLIPVDHRMVDHESGQTAAGLSYLVVTSKRLPIELSPTFRADMNFLALESCTGTTAAKV